MKWIEAKVIFDFNNKTLAFELVSNAFHELGLQGLVIEDPDTEPAEGSWDDEWKPPAHYPGHYAVTGYFPDNEQAAEKCSFMEQRLAGLGVETGNTFKIEYSWIDEKDWAESWKEYFLPEKVTDTIVVKPTWRDYNPNDGEIILEIDPGMAFGTGTHPTTSMCARLIEKHIKQGSFFLDVGTGSGVLMIASKKLGAEYVMGVDADKTAAEIAEKNLLLNRIDEKKFNVKTGNLIDAVGRKFDIVAANISFEVIIVLIEQVKKVLSEGGIFICSGFIERDKDTVTAKMEKTGFDIIDLLIKDKWISIAGKLKGA